MAAFHKKQSRDEQHLRRAFSFLILLRVKVNFHVVQINTQLSLGAWRLFKSPQMDDSAPLGRHSIAATAQWRAKIT